jgi:hypothetical protein
VLVVRRVLVLLLSATFLFAAPRAQFLSDYGAVRQRLDSRYSDWKQLNKSADFPVTLNRAWTIVGDWASAFLNSHPDASASELANAIIDLDRMCANCSDQYRLSAKAVPLARGKYAAWAVSVSYPRSGTFFVIARGGDGLFAVRWNIKELATRHKSLHDEIGHWAWNQFSWGDGPLVGVVGALPPGRTGRPRFYVDAHAVAIAGGTFPNQISVWEWDGWRAGPLFVRSYLVSLETPPIKVTDGTITIQAKGDYKSFSTCGACVEPEVTFQVNVMPDRATAGPYTYAIPELKACDALWDAIIHGRIADGLAAPQVVAVLHRLTQSMMAASLDHDRSRLLGMLMESKLSESYERRILELSADNTALQCAIRNRRTAAASTSPAFRLETAVDYALT